VGVGTGVMVSAAIEKVSALQIGCTVVISVTKGHYADMGSAGVCIPESDGHQKFVLSQ